jgi:hypothetical protein
MFNITLEHTNRIGLSMNLKCENMTKLDGLATYSKPNKTIRLDASRMYLEYLFTSHMCSQSFVRVKLEYICWTTFP